MSILDQTDYMGDDLTALQAQRRALEIVFGPIVFQVARIMRKIALLDLLAGSSGREGLTLPEICSAVPRSKYALQVLLESATTSGIVYLDATSADEIVRYRLTKTGYLLNRDKMIGVLIDFMHDVCYQGLFRLEQSLETGKPEGLKLTGDWPSLYQGLNALPEEIRESWFSYDHYFSDCTFDQAIAIVFDPAPRHVIDVGGNTGKWALQCVGHDPDVEVRVMDLPQQIALMQAETAEYPGADRISGLGVDFLTADASIPSGADMIWMSQFLDCFDEATITRILKLAAAAMTPTTRLYINEIYWDRQRYETAAFVLTQSSPYFTAMANGHSKFLYFPDLQRCLETAGLRVENNWDGLGWGHTLTLCRLA